MSAVDTYLVYRLIKDLGTDYEDMDAYKIGIIDEKGKFLRKPQGSEERKTYGPYQKLVVNLKRLLARVGIRSKIGTYAATMFFLREGQDALVDMEYKELKEKFRDVYVNLDENSIAIFDTIVEEAPANATGAAVSGTGDDGVHWVNKKDRKKKRDVLRRISKERFREVVKKL